MRHPWIPNSDDDTKRLMLGRIGVSSVEDLYSDIPEDIRYRGRLDVGAGKALSEAELERVIDEILDGNRVFKRPPPFLGGGVWPHHVPALVRDILRRGEFLTAYTPYQPEISQGLLQALFEYQSLIAELTGMDVVNASMYDWSTAAAEAFLMAVRATKRRKVIVPSTMNPQHLEVARTYLEPKGIDIVKVPYDTERGVISLEHLKTLVDDDTAAVYIENPSYLGFVEFQARGVGEIAKERGSLFVVGVDPISLGVLKAPGDYGADIVVGEGQPLGLGLNFGGPLLGIFGVKGDMKLVRQMPGRIIGVTTTVDGSKRGYAMVLQTREQHIRREKATSNICTNQALCALAAAVYLSLLGAEGLRRLGETIMYNVKYLALRMREELGLKAPVFDAPHFKEFVVDFSRSGTSYNEVHRRLLRIGIHGGKSLKSEFPELGDAALFCVTEVHTRADIDRLIEALKEILGV